MLWASFKSNATLARDTDAKNVIHPNVFVSFHDFLRRALSHNAFFRLAEIQRGKIALACSVTHR
jgi:hypothetical protein